MVKLESVHPEAMDYVRLRPSRAERYSVRETGFTKPTMLEPIMEEEEASQLDEDTGGYKVGEWVWVHEPKKRRHVGNVRAVSQDAQGGRVYVLSVGDPDNLTEETVDETSVVARVCAAQAPGALGSDEWV